jgi:hypothetical protein
VCLGATGSAIEPPAGATIQTVACSTNPVFTLAGGSIGALTQLEFGTTGLCVTANLTLEACSQGTPVWIVTQQVDADDLYKIFLEAGEQCLTLETVPIAAGEPVRLP